MSCLKKALIGKKEFAKPETCGTSGVCSSPVLDLVARAVEALTTVSIIDSNLESGTASDVASPSAPIGPTAIALFFW
jgi:hypothetical protein